uniref:Uncharacterized protein n=1 Tax=Trypanosoma vivax (strain Y486) TaxID=1055687 RepID=G0TVT4_TRYVY|nr:hypothetical protein, unlikely [Trypanosoma vivax Y486]
MRQMYSVSQCDCVKIKNDVKEYMGGAPVKGGKSHDRKASRFSGCACLRGPWRSGIYVEKSGRFYALARSESTSDSTYTQHENYITSQKSKKEKKRKKKKKHSGDGTTS